MSELLIVGSGCAGLAAAIYARRFEIDTLVIGDLPGGTITQTHLVENYPGFISLSGYELGEKLLAHAKNLGADIQNGQVKHIEKVGDGFQAQVGEKSILAKAVILATGTAHRKLEAPGEKEFQNKGASYCATCDAPFFKNKTVAIVGGSDSAVKESLIAAEHAAQVYIIYRGSAARAEPINIRRMEANEKIELITEVNIVEIYGEGVVKGVKLDDGQDLKLDGVFIEIGRIPRSELASSLGVAVSENGEIIIDRNSRTNVPGVLAAGDVTDTAWKQAITGAGEGAQAANSAFEFLNSK